MFMLAMLPYRVQIQWTQLSEADFPLPRLMTKTGTRHMEIDEFSLEMIYVGGGLSKNYISFLEGRVKLVTDQFHHRFHMGP